MDEAALREHEEVTKVKNVNYIEIGRHRMETWYFSPLPKEMWKDGIIETVSPAATPAPNCLRMPPLRIPSRQPLCSSPASLVS